MAKPAFTPMSFDDLEKKVSYADVYEVNDTKVNVQDEIKLKWITSGNYKLRSCLALEVDGGKSCGYKAYVRGKESAEWKIYSPKTLLGGKGETFFTDGEDGECLTNMRSNGIVFVYEKVENVEKVVRVEADGKEAGGRKADDEEAGRRKADGEKGEGEEEEE